MKSCAIATFVSLACASHLDNVNGVFDTFTYDSVRFKTQTNCQLDTYPEVRLESLCNKNCDRSANSLTATLPSSPTHLSSLLVKAYPASSSSKTMRLLTLCMCTGSPPSPSRTSCSRWVNTETRAALGSPSLLSRSLLRPSCPSLTTFDVSSSV